MDSQKNKNENMKAMWTIVVGSIFAWVGDLMALLALLECCLSIFCTCGMIVDKGPVDHYWNCGVLIHGSLFLVWSAIAVSFLLTAKLLLKGEWWKLPIVQIEAVFGFRCK
jgi:hypothetical protein